MSPQARLQRQPRGTRSAVAEELQRPRELSFLFLLVCACLALAPACHAQDLPSADEGEALPRTGPFFRQLLLIQGEGQPRTGRSLLVAEDEDGPHSRKMQAGNALQSGGRAVMGEGAPVGAGARDVSPLGAGLKKKGMLDAFVSSLSMILVTEIGDETFIIAALMAMRHSRAVVLAGALSALAIMTVLSTCLGMIVPNLISRQATNRAAAGLYTFFGLRLLYIAWRSDPKDTPQKEMEEVEEKLEEDENSKGRRGAVRKFLAGFCTPVFLEAFILTFLAEWGDRSQIATITLAAHKNAVGVTIGATLGHVLCTSLAVLGGRLLALKISQRTVATIGGLLFLVFAVHSYFAPIIDD